jgi:hypothetical protein
MLPSLLALGLVLLDRIVANIPLEYAAEQPFHMA